MNRSVKGEQHAECKEGRKQPGSVTECCICVRACVCVCVCVCVLRQWSSRQYAKPEGWSRVTKSLGSQTEESGSMWWAVETRCKPLASEEQSQAKFWKVSSGVCVGGETGGEERSGGAGGSWGGLA